LEVEEGNGTILSKSIHDFTGHYDYSYIYFAITLMTMTRMNPNVGSVLVFLRQDPHEMQNGRSATHVGIPL
jgi:hypothetical protein